MKKTDLQALKDRLEDLAPKLLRYRLVVFVCFVLALYGFLLLKINNLGNLEPSPDAVSSQVQAAQVPRINQSVVDQLKSLQDNSVNVQALFNQARQNPFQ